MTGLSLDFSCRNIRLQIPWVTHKGNEDIWPCILAYIGHDILRTFMYVSRPLMVEGRAARDFQVLHHYLQHLSEEYNSPIAVDFDCF